MTTVTPTGNPATVWAATQRAVPAMAVTALAPGATRLVVLAAHPDDESIGAGRLIHSWSRSRGTVDAFCMTAGEACFDHVGLHVPDLAGKRRAEFARASRELGVRDAECWGLPDGGLLGALRQVASDLDDLAHWADVVMSPWRFDPHPDHAALGSAAAVACARTGTPLWEYPIWMGYWQRPEILSKTATRLLRIAVDADADAARDRAVACHTSQLQAPAPGVGPVVTPEMLEHHREQLLLVSTGIAP